MTPNVLAASLPLLPAALVYTPDEAAQFLRLSRSRIYELLDENNLASIKIGRSRRIHRDELERLAREGCA